MSRLILIIAVVAGCVHGAVPSNDTALATLAGKRAEIIGWLHDYRVAGVFPADAAGNPVSVFVDERGVRCPMAELVHKSGRDDLVEAVRKEGNAVRLADVHLGALYDWMISSGLTQQEVAMVQGAMNIEMTNRLRGEWTAAIEQAEVRGQLEMAESALRQATAASLVIASQRLSGRDVTALATSPLTGHVLTTYSTEIAKRI